MGTGFDNHNGFRGRIRAKAAVDDGGFFSFRPVELGRLLERFERLDGTLGDLDYIKNHVEAFVLRGTSIALPLSLTSGDIENERIGSYSGRSSTSWTPELNQANAGTQESVGDRSSSEPFALRYGTPATGFALPSLTTTPF